MNRRKAFRIVLVVALAAVVSVGATLAFLTATTPTVTNVFSFSSGVGGVIQEPRWDDRTYDVDDDDWVTPTPPTAEEDLGRDRAVDIVPGRIIPKNPALVNTSDLDIYGALEIRFVNGNGEPLTNQQLTALMDNIAIDWNGADWTLMDGARNQARHTVRFNTIIPAFDPVSGNPLTDSRTSAYFTTVTVSSNISTDDLAILQGIPGGFHIRINGAVVQAEGLASSAAAAATLSGLFLS